MANYNIEVGQQARQQIAAVALIIGGIAGALFSSSNGFVGLFIGAALSFVLALISRALGVLICLLGGLAILGYFTGG